MVTEPYNLMCAFCFVLPGRSQGADALAGTVINGHATCQRHHEFALISSEFRVCLAPAEEWERDMLDASREPR